MEKEKKTISQWADEHPSLVFWFRFVCWLLAAIILPFLFVAFRFDLFEQVNKVSIGLPELFVIGIGAGFLFSLLRYIKAGFKGRYTFIGQCIAGLLKITLPLIIFYAVINVMKDNIEYFLQSLGCVVLCETIAIPLNPMPKWANDMQKDLKEEERKDFVDYIFSKIKSNKKEGE
jgi:hypothetical protein